MDVCVSRERADAAACVGSLVQNADQTRHAGAGIPGKVGTICHTGRRQPCFRKCYRSRCIGLVLPREE